MSIINRDFEKAISSNDAALIRGEMGIDKGNKFIQDTWNKVHNGHKCGYDKPKYGNNNRQRDGCKRIYEARDRNIS